MRTITAMFDSRADAEAARTRLAAAGVSTDDVSIHDQGTTGLAGDHAAHHEGRGVWESIKSFFSGDEHVYEEGMRRGGHLLTARVDDTLADRAIDILDDDGTVDLDQRSSAWRNEGWSGVPMTTGLAATGAAGAAGWRDADREGTGAAQDYRRDGNLGDRMENGVERATGTGAYGRDYDGDGDRNLGDRVKEGWDKLTGKTTDDTHGLTGAAGTRGTAGMGSDALHGEDVIPLVEERLNVGKREVSRGGVRVRSYVVETPVSEDVRLREEHVDVERRPVTGATGARSGTEGDLFRERVVEARETAEVPVVEKQAVVTEEVAVTRHIDERVERIEDSVRRTEVDVDRLGSDDRRTDRDSDLPR